MVIISCNCKVSKLSKWTRGADIIKLMDSDLFVSLFECSVLFYGSLPIIQEFCYPRLRCKFSYWGCCPSSSSRRLHAWRTIRRKIASYKFSNRIAIQRLWILGSRNRSDMGYMELLDCIKSHRVVNNGTCQSNGRPLERSTENV